MALEFPTFTSGTIGNTNAFRLDEGKYALVGLYAAPFLNEKKGRVGMSHNLAFVSVDDNGNVLGALKKARNVLTDDMKVALKNGIGANSGKVVSDVKTVLLANTGKNIDLTWFFDVCKSLYGKVLEVKHDIMLGTDDKTKVLLKIEYANTPAINVANNIVRSNIEGLFDALAKNERVAMYDRVINAIDASNLDNNKKTALKAQIDFKFYLYTPGEKVIVDGNELTL